MSPLDRARDLVLRHGWNTTCYQILNPGLDLWFSSSGDAVIGYVRRGGTLIVAGAPVCALDRLGAVVREFEREKSDHRIAYFGAEGRLRDLLSDRPGYATVVLGAQPSWSPGAFVQASKGDGTLRAQLNRSRNKGVTVSEWPRETAENHPVLRTVLREWLATRGLPPLHFLVEPETLGDLRDRRLFVAEKDTKPVAFVTLCPVPERNGWLTEQFVRGRGAPNGTIELALYHAACEAIDDDYLTMGIVPLSSHGTSAARNNPFWLRYLATWVSAHGRRFYNFKGLDYFKSKFRPEKWEPIVVISNEERFSFGTLYAIAAAFTVGSPVIAVLKGMGRALRQEFRWLLER